MVVLSRVSTVCDMCIYYACDRALVPGIPIPTPANDTPAGEKPAGETPAGKISAGCKAQRKNLLEDISQDWPDEASIEILTGVCKAKALYSHILIHKWEDYNPNIY